jgi:catalase
MALSWSMRNSWRITIVSRPSKNILKKNLARAPVRVFHAKSHGCLLGEARLLPERAGETRHGIFGDNAPDKYPILARFSNGKGTTAADWLPDVRGLALKLFGVQSGTETERTVDFLLTNSQVAFGTDHAEFGEFMEASKDGPPEPAFCATHPRVITSLLKCMVPPRSVAELTYGGGHAYLLGPNRAMKIKLEPRGDHLGFLDAAVAQFHLIEDHDFLRHELEMRVATKGVSFTLSVQLENERDPATTPIEDALFEWTEEHSSSLPIAELVFEPQAMVDARREYVDTLPFNPWNYHPEHRPLGNLARGRLFSYAASRGGRMAQQDLSFATVLEGDQWIETTEGTPQGAVASPLLWPTCIYTMSTISGSSSGANGMRPAT